MDQVTDAARAHSNPSLWETFCRDEAKQWASAFLERVRSFKLRNSVTSGVHDSTFTNEFSAAFLEETSILLSVENGMQSNGEATGLATSLPTASTQSISSSPDVSSPRKSNKKSWFSHLFKWSKSQRARRSNTTNASRQARLRRSTNAINDDLVRMLNLNAEDSMSAWQCCRLVLLEENGTHQLEVYSPPKSSVPKMSLFCFLIKEVRPATSLEIPDSTSCLVIKSQNHGEYVFDAGSEDKQRRWISIIRAYSANLAPPTNGHLPGYSAGGGLRPRSHSIGAGDHRSSLAATLPPPIALANAQRAARFPSENRLFPPTAADMTNSNESVMVDVSSFIRSSPNRSPSRRRKVHSMFIESTLTTQLDSARNSQATPTSQGVGFPYDSPCPSPPPLPKRGMRPKNVAILNSPVLEKNPKPSSPSLRSITTPSEGNTPQRRMSQPQIELHNVSTPELLPSNLDSCSISSSSSALHPVTLADIERRGPLSPSHLRYSSQLSILSEGRGATATKPSNSRVRKISAPLLVPHQPYVERDVVHPELSTTVVSKNHSSDNFHAASPTAGNRDSDQSERITPNNDEIRDTAEDMSSKATLNFPIASRSYSPNSQPRTPSDEEPQMDTPRRLVPYTRLNVSSLVEARSNQPPASLRGNEPERSHSQASNNTEGSEDPTQPLYIETTGNEGVSQSSPHTRHPYENWATTPQDVTNLRQLSQFPWFHGMISRNNASQLVLGEGDGGTGQYLVRQSESRESDFVLTFNYHNRAKHLRLTLDGNGCNIQHLWFDDVPGMLEYFKTNSIPLESFWLNNDVKLTTFIDRKKSDAFRTTTVVNVARLNRAPPGRSRSFHITMSQAVSTETRPPLDRSVSSASSTTSTNSLPPGARNGVGVRSLFRSQRSSSAGNMNVHGVRSGATVQRRHSTNAGSVLDTRGRGSGRGSIRNGQNTYVYRNY